MTTSSQTQWDQLSSEIASVAQRCANSIAAVHGGRRIAGSGICWRAGVIVTANHMLRRTEQIEVSFGGGSSAQATLVGRDSGTDIAVLKADSETQHETATPGTTESLNIGQFVLALGRSTFGDLSASFGIIARTGAAWQTWRGGKIQSLLRPDITLYPGQSGSALLDSSGRVLGMNTSALARGAAITVPTLTVDRVVDEILEHGGVFRPYLGIAMQPVAVPKDLAGKLSHPGDTALMIMQVEPDSPSAQAGLMLGDIIVSANQKPLTDIEHIQDALRNAKRGDSVVLGYVRGGQLASATVTLGDRPRR